MLNVLLFFVMCTSRYNSKGECLLSVYSRIAQMLSDLPHDKLFAMCQDFRVSDKVTHNALPKKKTNKRRATARRTAAASAAARKRENAAQVCPFETADAFIVRQLAAQSSGCAYIDSQEWWSKTVRRMSIRSLIQFGLQVGLLELDEDIIKAIIVAIKTAFSGGQLSILQDVHAVDVGADYFPRDIHATLVIIVLWFRRWHDKGLYKNPKCLPVISMNGT